MAESKYDDLEYHELQAEAKERDLPASGSADQLIERLEEDDEASEDSTEELDAVVVEVPESSVTEAGPSSEEDEDGFVGVSSDVKHRPASIHYSPKPGSGESDDDDED